MTVLTEREVQISLPDGVSGRKFDGPDHGLSHCMKAVDFIIETGERILFIEIKDPDNSKAPPEERKEFRAESMDHDLKTKFRDSWLYEWAEGRAHKPVFYFVLIGAETLSDAELLARTDSLKRLIPINGPKGRTWQRPFAHECIVFNLESWNKALPNYPVSRIKK